MDTDVYFIRASRVQPRLGKRMLVFLGGLQQRPEEIFTMGEAEHNPAPNTTDEQATMLWQVTQIKVNL